MKKLFCDYCGEEMEGKEINWLNSTALPDFHEKCAQEMAMRISKDVYLKEFFDTVKKQEECVYCEPPHKYMTNTHVNAAPIKMFMFTGQGQKPGLIVLLHGSTEAVIDVNFCPMCGRQLPESEAL